MGDTSDTLDAASTTWFTALCTGLSGLKADSTKMQSAGAVGTDTEKLKALSPVLLDISSQYTNTAMTLTSLPSPGFPGGSDYAQKAIAAFGELGDAFQAAGTTAANGDNSKVATLTTDSTSGPGAQAMSAIAVTAQTKAAINKIPVCASSGVMS